MSNAAVEDEQDEQDEKDLYIIETVNETDNIDFCITK